MESRELLPLLQSAIKRKQNLILVYEGYIQSHDNPKAIAIVENMLEKEQQHLDLLQSIRESVLHGKDIPVSALSRLISSPSNWLPPEVIRRAASSDIVSSGTDNYVKHQIKIRYARSTAIVR